MGALLARQELEVTDPAVLSAIATHTFLDKSANFHAPLNGRLRFADLYEPGRSGKELQDQLRPLVFSGNWRAAVHPFVAYLANFYQQIEFPQHPDLLGLLEEFGGQEHELHS